MPTVQPLETRELHAVYRNTAVEQGFLSSLLIGGMIMSEKDRVEFDIEETDYGMAPHVRPLDEGMATRGAGFSTRWFRPAYVKMKDAITIASNRPIWYAGEREYSALSKQQRVNLQRAHILTRHRRMLRNRREWSCARLATEGAYPITYQGSTGEVLKTFTMGYGRKANLDVTPAVNWDLPTGQPANDLETWLNLLATEGECTPFAVVLGRDVHSHLVSHNDFNDLMHAGSKLRASAFDVGKPKVRVRNGAREIGSYGNIDYYTYTGQYRGADGVRKYYVDPKEMLIVASADEMPVPIITQMYGAIHDLESLNVTDAFMKEWIEHDPSARQLLTQSAPLLLQHNPNLILRATVIT